MRQTDSRLYSCLCSWARHAEPRGPRRCRCAAPLRLRSTDWKACPVLSTAVSLESLLRRTVVILFPRRPKFDVFRLERAAPDQIGECYQITLLREHRENPGA